MATKVTGLKIVFDIETDKVIEEKVIEMHGAETIPEFFKRVQNEVEQTILVNSITDKF